MDSKESLDYLAEISKRQGDDSWNRKINGTNYNFSHSQAKQLTFIEFPEEEMLNTIVVNGFRDGGLELEIDYAGKSFLLDVDDNGVIKPSSTSDIPFEKGDLAKLTNSVDKHIANLMSEAHRLEKMEQEFASALSQVSTTELVDGKSHKEINRDLEEIPVLDEAPQLSKLADKRAGTLHSITKRVSAIRKLLDSQAALQASLAREALGEEEPISLANFAVIPFSEENMLKIEEETLVSPISSRNNVRLIIVSKDVTRPTVVMFDDDFNNGLAPVSAFRGQTFASIILPHKSMINHRLIEALYGHPQEDEYVMDNDMEGHGNLKMPYPRDTKKDEIAFWQGMINNHLESLAKDLPGMTPAQILERIDTLDLKQERARQTPIQKHNYELKNLGIE